MRRAFTLIEMMVSITIFSLVVLLLYRSYASLERSNAKYHQKERYIEHLFRIKRMFYLDFSLVLDENLSVLPQQNGRDVVLLQTSNSLHDRIDPYVAYVVKNETLYRIESLQPLKSYPFGADVGGDVDEVAKVRRFRVYKALKKENNATRSLFLIDCVTREGEHILYKIAALNQY